MPEEGVEWQEKSSILTFEEIETLVRLLVKRGVTKVRITGGEPTIRKGYIDLVERLASIAGLDHVCLTTNGSTLCRDASSLKKAGLTSLNVSLDSLRPDRFASITRRQGLVKVLDGIHSALAEGLEVKVNVVLMPGINDDEILDFAELTKDLQITVRFIEFMPFLNNGWSSTRVISSAEVRSVLATRYKLEAEALGANDVARDYQIAGHQGKLGFISSVTESFCAGCNRLRLTADGQLKSCLFLPPAVSLRDLLRQGASDAELEQAVSDCLQSKWKEHPPMQGWNQRDHLSMVQIGG